MTQFLRRLLRRLVRQRQLRGYAWLTDARGPAWKPWRSGGLSRPIDVQVPAGPLENPNTNRRPAFSAIVRGKDAMERMESRAHNQERTSSSYTVSKLSFGKALPIHANAQAHSIKLRQSTTPERDKRRNSGKIWYYIRPSTRLERRMTTASTVRPTFLTPEQLFGCHWAWESDFQWKNHEKN